MSATANEFVSVDIPVLVNEDVTYAECRIDHAKRLMLYGRPAEIAAASHPLAMMQVPRPPPQMFEDPFVSVYPVIEEHVYSISLPKSAARHLGLVTIQSTRLQELDQEDLFHRTDNQSLFVLSRSGKVSAYSIEAFAIEFPDLNGDEWQEPWHRGQAPESMLQPFRQIRTLPAGPQQSFPALTWASRNTSFDAEYDAWAGDLDVYARSTANLGAVYWIRQLASVAPPIAPITYVRVRANAVGDFNGVTRNIGDVFDIPSSALAGSTINYLVGTDEYDFGWMTVVPPNTALATNSPTAPNVTIIYRTVY